MRLNSNLTFNLGVRWDKNRGVDSAGTLVAESAKLAPRLGVVWDPTGDGVWSVSGSYGIYTAAIRRDRQLASPGGTGSTLQWTYTGPPINPDPDGPHREPGGSGGGHPAGARLVHPRCARLLHGGLAVEFHRSRRLHQGRRGFAVAECEQLRRWGEPPGRDAAVVRADYSFRDYNDFYSLRTDHIQVSWSMSSATDPT